MIEQTPLRDHSWARRDQHRECRTSSHTVHHNAKKPCQKHKEWKPPADRRGGRISTHCSYRRPLRARSGHQALCIGCSVHSLLESQQVPPTPRRRRSEGVGIASPYFPPSLLRRLCGRPQTSRMPNVSRPKGEVYFVCRGGVGLVVYMHGVISPPLAWGVHMPGVHSCCRWCL